ncbi:MAG: arsenate reductase (glutaredoxin) [Bacteroidales bacterium]|nr:arsenate reductase (glutaredoxin) [Bacteroidales bacterium]
MLNIYHNPRCKKSRAGLQYLLDKGLDPNIIDYLKNPLSEAELKHLLMKLHLTAFEMVRTQEAIYKSDFKGLKLTEDEWIKIIVENPKLLKRPIVETKLKAVWGDPAELIEKVL